MAECESGSKTLSGMDSLSRDIQDQLLSCKICLDNLKEPKSLPCLHTFCADCLHIYIEHNRVDSRKFACPICRRQVYIPKSGVDGFPDSFFVASLADLLQEKLVDKHCGICKFKSQRLTATSLCVECKIELCEDCSKAHSSTTLTEKHTMLPLMPPEEAALAHGGHLQYENYCRIHQGQTIKYFCAQCKTTICLPCTFLEHKDHKVEELNDVRKKCVKEMAGLVVQGNEALVSLEHTKTQLAALEHHLLSNREMVKQDIRRAIQKVHRLINEQEACLMNQLDDAMEVESVSHDLQMVERVAYRLEVAQDYVQQLLADETSPLTQISSQTEATHSLQRALEFQLPQPADHQQKLQQSVKFLPGNLQQFNLGSVLCCSGPIPRQSHLLSLPKVHPSTKAVFLHSLRLDHSTPIEILAVEILPSKNIVLLASLEEDKKFVQVYSRSTGRLKYQFSEGFNNPSDLALTKNSHIALTDCGDQNVKVFDIVGTKRLEFGGPDIFQLPISLSVDNISNFLVCDQGYQQLTIHRNNGELLQTISISNIILPQFIKVSGSTIYIADCEHKQIAIYSYNNMKEEANLISNLTAPQDQSGDLLDCSGICMDRYGNLLVSDAVLDRVHCFSQQGELSVIVAHGKSFRRPSCLSNCSDNLLAVVMQGVDTLDETAMSNNCVSIYKLMNVDV